MGKIPISFDLERGAAALKYRAFSERLPGSISFWNQVLSAFPVADLPAGIAFLDREFILRRQNRQYADYLRLYSPLGPDQALGRCYFDYMPGSRDQLEEWFRETRDCGRSETQYGYPLRLTYPTRENLTYWNVSMTAVSRWPSRVEGIVIFCVDLTPEKRASQILHAQQTELARQAQQIEDAKNALRFLQALREEDKKELGLRLAANTRNLILPALQLLKNCCPDQRRRTLLQTIETSLEEIVGPFSRRLQSTAFNLTPKEIAVANHIKSGRTSKEIAGLLSLSPASIDFHRNNIRKKLGIHKRKEVGLREYLISRTGEE
ncbi:MAG: PAS domain-containing protein [Deltaproteobacteria bacterium]|nr:PAS domain-containing protein [Deltaproteobacteria bacterium]